MKGKCNSALDKSGPIQGIYTVFETKRSPRTASGVCVVGLDELRVFPREAPGTIRPPHAAVVSMDTCYWKQ